MTSLRTRRSLALLPLVALSLLTACGGGDSTSTEGEGGSNGGGAAGTGAGGKAGGGGSAGKSAGGSAGTSAGGSAGTSAGGKAGSSAGGSSGAAGSAGTSAGGASGASAGGTDAGGSSGQAGSDAGGSAGSQAGGSAGSDAGGAAGDATAGGAAGGAGCATGELCGSDCVDTKTDAANCGACGKACNGTNGTAACVDGQCTVACDAGFFDCDGSAETGCESSVACLCKPGEAVECYSGPDGTKGVGACKAGQQVCDATGLAFGACAGDVLPQPESCATLADDDCDGQVNEEGTDCACVPGVEQACGVSAGTKVSNVDPADQSYSATSACKVGTQTCKPDGTGFTECLGAVAPVAEDCGTALDDNCNGQVNEPGPNSNCACQPGELKACYEGPAGTENVGVCKGGTATCKDDGSGFGACAGQVLPSKEVCDGGQTDENCDGKVNETGGDPSCVCVANTQKACYSGPAGTAGVGLCKTGLQTCKADGTGYGACEGQVVPKAESCQAGKLDDEDCDGEVNEGGPGCGCAPGNIAQCYANGLGSPQLSAPKGICIAGFQVCGDDGVAYGACQNQVLPQTEVCDEAGVDEDCDGLSNEGGVGCDCAPGATAECWEGPASAKFGAPSICKKGTKTCQASGKWGACQNQTLPGFESPDVCTPSVDEDCDGDPLGPAGKDNDKDGWTVCGGDCCDSTANCTKPELVNPGAFDVAGNNLDDDCDGAKDNAPTSCDSGLASNSATGTDYAKAIDLCQFTTENPPLEQKKWGVISAQLLLASGAGTPSANSRSIRTGFGTTVKPNKGSSFAVLSTGNAADTNDTSPPYAAFQGGQDTGTTSGFPADWLAANNNSLPNAPGCPAPTGASAVNPVMLKVRVRVPTNAQSFSFNSYFYSSEYPEWVCSPYNDFFVALLNSSFNGQPANPTDLNLAFYQSGNNKYPVGVNLAKGNTGLFQICKNGTIGCANGSVQSTIATCTSSTDLGGTGFEFLNPGPKFGGDPGYCGSNNQLGGATGYLTSSGNVKPGETIEVRFAIWDTSDAWYDSVVLLDNWAWSLSAAQPGTVVSQ